ncbi:hypothetical protein [Alistipes senegalensis]|uniref:hypothetical protein n=1 Tax=Alistipes senegalensis TaxID=1288121 RepID=UPI0018A8EAEA|nr:hypothetical protein [Alistipes senegalensis]
MKRKISLYIGGKLADLSTDALVQMNYTAEDLSDPAIVKNSYSQQVTLPATRKNDAIFGGIFRADRRTVGGDGSTGASFNPLVRTPFAIYDEAGDLLESGYMKLDSITAKDGSPAYVITLYGGLGSFFYTLSYDDEGNEMTLGNLPLLDNAEEQIGFTINKETVGAAWAALRAGTAGQWQVVNFAPAYNGFPDSGFSADKAVGKPSEVGGKDSTTVGEKTYQVINNNALFDLGEDFTEWQTKDLRSYLQRPVVSVKSLIAGISRFAVSRGFTLDLDPEFFSSINPYYADAWMTLPLLSTYEREGEQEDVSLSGNAITDDIKVGKNGFPATRYMAPYLTVPDAKVEVSMTVHPAVAMSSNSLSRNKFILNRGIAISGNTNGNEGTAVFAQLLLCDASGKIISGSPLQVFLSSHLYREWPAANLVSASGIPYESQYGVNETIAYEQLTFQDSMLGGVYWWKMPNGVTLEATGYGVAQAYIRVYASVINIQNSNYKFESLYEFHAYALSLDGSISVRQTLSGWGAIISDAKAVYNNTGGYRSDSVITQKVLFGDTMTPAAFLLSYSKMLGLSYIYDKGTKTVRLVTRNTLYDGEVIDLQTRIDRSKEIKTTPMVASTKWLSFSAGESEGTFVEFYRNKYGREYGSQKVNTGYDFNADTKDVLESVEFKGGAEVLEKSTYFNNLTLDGKKIPSPFLNGKASYRLYSNGDINDSTELEGLTPGGPGLVIDYFVENMPSYDILPKLQCHGNDNSAADGNNILLFHRGFIADDVKIAAAYARFIITDDSTEMYRLNEGPCWELSKGDSAANMPIFGRHFMDGSVVKYSMDLGVPVELDIPFVAVDTDAAVYARSWQKYIEDRYNVDTRVRSAYVDFWGIQVGEHLLHKFYFADNAIWVLNKISNYSLTGAGTTQCEFVKVQDRKAYIEGQLILKYYLTLNGAAGDVSIDVVANGGQTDVAYDTNGTLQILGYSGDAVRSAVINGSNINIYCNLNTTSEQRTGQVTVYLKEAPSIERKIVVMQAGAIVPTLSLDFDEEMPWAATRHTVGVINTNNQDIKVYSLPSWFVPGGTPFTIEQGRTYRLEMYENDSTDMRTGIFDIRDIYGRYKTEVEVSQIGAIARMVIIDASTDPSLKGQSVLTDFELLSAEIHNTEMINTQVDSDGIISLTLEQVAGYLNIPSLDDYEGDVLEVSLPDVGISGSASVTVPGDIHITLK